MKVVCVKLGKKESADAKQDAWLTVGKEYVVLTVYGLGTNIKYRLLSDDRWTPALHSSELFEMSSSKIPPGWVFQHNSVTLEWVLMPSVWTGEGFWIAYFDGDATAKRLFESTVDQVEASS